MNPLTQSKRTTMLPVLIALGLFALAPAVPAVCEEGCLANQNTVLGDDALINNTGANNTAIGFEALFSNTAGTENTAVGLLAMYKNTNGLRNTAAGHNALSNYTTGSFNTAFGYQALLGGDNGIGTGSNNTAVGYWALIGNQGGSNNTATGYLALFGSPDEFSDCSNNTADGANAMYSNLTGSNNVASGTSALYSNTTGNFNTAGGQNALFSNTTGRNNTADGQNALGRNTTGSNNIALGSNAGSHLTTGSNNIDIFHIGVAGEANTMRIGQQGTQTTTFIAGISGATVPRGVAVIVDSSGHLGTTTSSARFKQAIKPMDKASEAILALQPVTFRYKKELDPDGIPQFGLVAEEVEKVNPDLVARDDQGKPYAVRYEAVNAMLLNEFLNEHRTVQEQGATIARLEKQVEALTAGLQKVTARLEVSKPATETVSNGY